MRGFRLSLHTLFCSIEKEEKISLFYSFKMFKEKKKKQIYPAGVAEWKNAGRMDLLSSLSNMRSCIGGGGGLEGGGEAKGGWEVWGRGHQSARAGFEDPPSSGGRRGGD